MMLKICLVPTFSQVAETDQLSYVGTTYDAESTAAGANTCKWVTDGRASLPLGLAQLCQHNFEHNRYKMASGIMLA